MEMPIHRSQCKRFKNKDRCHPTTSQCLHLSMSAGGIVPALCSRWRWARIFRNFNQAKFRRYTLLVPTIADIHFIHSLCALLSASFTSLRGKNFWEHECFRQRYLADSTYASTSRYRIECYRKHFLKMTPQIF